jgi:hypothetical protein
MMAWRSPRWMSRSTPRMISLAPKFFFSPWRRIAGALMPCPRAAWPAWRSRRLRRLAADPARQANADAGDGERGEPGAGRTELQLHAHHLGRRVASADSFAGEQGIAEFDQADQAGQQDQHRQRRRQVVRQHAAEQSGLPQVALHRDHAGDAARRHQYHEEEEQAEVEQPGVGHAADHDLHHGDQDGADDRAVEEADAADEGHQQHHARGVGVERFGGDDFVVQRRKAAGDAGKQPDSTTIRKRTRSVS